MCRNYLMALLILVASLAASPCQADQLSWVDQKTADKAMATLKPGTVICYWVVNNEKATPEILKITSIWADPVDSKYAKGFKQLFIEFERLAVGEWQEPKEEGAERKLDWQMAHPDGEMKAIDLAYVFTRTPKSLSKFESFAKAQKLECDLKKSKFTLPKVIALKVKAQERRRVTEATVRAG